MKYVILLLIMDGSLYFSFNNKLSCYEQGHKLMTSLATYQGPGPKQGWYTNRGDLVYGYYCE